MATTANDKPTPEPIPRRRFGMRDLWRVGFWGVAAAAAVGGTVFACSTDVAEDRLMLAVAYLRGAIPSPAQIARDNDTETRRLAAAVRTLSADRDRLQTRLSAIEHNVEDLTGSIARRSTEFAAPSQPQLAPAIAAPDTIPMVNVPVPRLVPSPAAPPDTTPQVEFGIDLGGATNIEGLRVIWASAKSRHGALLENLRPIMTVRENTRPGGVELRLVAGPLANASLAARLCGAFANSGAACQPAVFDGQRLAFSEGTPRR